MKIKKALCYTESFCGIGFISVPQFSITKNPEPICSARGLVGAK